MSNAYPYAFQNTFDNDRSMIVDNSNIVRREEYDPYGFNSILSRFYKRSNNKHNNHFPNQMYFVWWMKISNIYEFLLDQNALSILDIWFWTFQLENFDHTILSVCIVII